MPEIPLFIGSYTSGDPYFPGSSGAGVSRVLFDADSGSIRLIDMPTRLLNPSWIEAGSSGGVFALSENFDGDGEVSRIFFDRQKPAVEVLGKVAGRAACHFCVLPGHRSIAAVSYLDGIVSIIDLDNKCGGRTFQLSGKGPHATRQTSPHPHQAVLSPGGGWLLVPDLGADVIWKFPVNALLNPQTRPEAIRVADGTGPRHLVFLRNGETFAVAGELDGVVHLIAWDETTGACHSLARVETAPGLPTGMANASAIRRHPVCSVLYVGNRQDHRLAVIDVSQHRQPQLRQTIDLPVRTPRDLQLTPDGRWLLVAGQDSNEIAVYRVDNQGSVFSSPALLWPCGSPACLLFP
jgi:6-phosphogluconolactonase